MKLVLSRKGFDATYGGMPSPIMPDGTLVPLPIPSTHDQATFADLDFPGVDLGALLHDLSGGRHRLASTIHLDPDLERPPRRRLSGWLPALGQTGAAQQHLARQGVGRGDVFLFFGWFREAERHRGCWRYRPGAADLHVLFGWLEVGDVVAIVTARQQAIETYPWCIEHAHVANPAHYDNPANTLYVGTPASRFAPEASAGGGRFHHFTNALQLTRPGASRSYWTLPGCFMPASSETALTYHTDLARWEAAGDRIHLRSVAKGQEFILDCGRHPGSEEWVAGIIARHGTSCK